MKLAFGQWIRFEHDEHRIVGFVGPAVRLWSNTGATQLIDVGTLAADATFSTNIDCEHTEVSNGPDVDGVAMPWGHACDWEALWQDAPSSAQASAHELERHLLEVLTGFPNGPGNATDQDKPRQGYEPERRLTDRVQLKASELGRSSRRVWQLLREYRQNGIIGLIDKRTLRLHDPLGRLDQRIRQAIWEQASYEVRDSTGSVNRFMRRVRNRLDTTYGAGAVALPSKRTFERAVSAVLNGHYTFGPAMTRRTAANARRDMFGHVVAFRPGEIVMIDTTRLDVFAYDPAADTDVPCEITLAIDLYSRSLLGWRITPRGTKDIDIGLVVADAMTPEPMRAGWPETLRFSMLAIGGPRILSIDQRLETAAARPVIYPETLLVDQGRQYKSDVVERACARLAVNFTWARKGQPTDKPEVESLFSTVGKQFSEHVAGYKGSDVAGRGVNPQHQARWTIAQLEEFFAEYVVAVYQRRWHEGLVIPTEGPTIRVSPNEAYAIGVARAGYVACPSDPDLYYALMPIKWRMIGRRGVQIDYLYYDAPVLDDYRGSRSPYEGHGWRWPIHCDPRNRLHAYFCDREGEWHVLTWSEADDGTQPFTDITLHEAIHVARHTGARFATETAVTAALIHLQNRTDAVESWTSTDRRRAMRDAERARVEARDAHNASLARHERHRNPTMDNRRDPDRSVSGDGAEDEAAFDPTQVDPAPIWNPHLGD